MTRKDYVLLADALRLAMTHAETSVYQTPQCRVEAVYATAYAIGRVADALARDNAHFDRARFLTAAGVAGGRA